MKRCKKLLIEMLAISGLLICGPAIAGYGTYNLSSLEGPATDADGDYWLTWLVIPVSYLAEYDTVQIAVLETRMNDTGSWDLVQQWNNIPIYAAYENVHRTGQDPGKHNYRMFFLTYGPYTGYDYLEDYWDVEVDSPPPPPPADGITAPPSEVTSGLAAGATPYAIDVAGNGDAVAQIPLELMPGVAGLQPQLAISYSSGRGVARTERSLPEDTIGYGWQLTGTSQIRRCVVGQSSTNTIDLDASDSICLDGMPLVKTSGTHWDVGATYRPQIDNFSRIEIKGSAGALWFEVRTADGTVLEYGNGTGSRVDKSGGTDYQWSLNKATDPFNNQILYTYHHDATNGINYPVLIEYAGAQVQFEYRTRTDAAVVNIGSAAQTQSVFLHTIRVVMNSIPVREYRLLDEVVSSHRRLAKIQQCGYDASGISLTCLAPLAMSWGAPSPAMTAVPIYLTGIANGLGATDNFEYGTITQGGSHAFLFSGGPFGTPSAPPDTQLLSAGSGQPLRHVATRLRRDNGIGGQHATSYAYLGVGLESTLHWGFTGFYAHRAQDEVSDIVTYTQYRLHYPYFGQVARILQYDDFYGSHTQILARVENDFGQQTTVTGAVYPFLGRSVNFLYEGGTELGVIETLNTPTLSSGLVTGIVSTVSTATAHSEGSTGSTWGDVPARTLTSVVHANRITTEFDNRTSGGQWLIGFADDVTTESWLGAAGSGTPITQRVTATAHSSSMKVASSVNFPGHSTLQLTTTHTRDSAGRITATNVVGQNVSSRTVNFSSFGANRYPTVITNPLSQQTQVGSLDLRFGVPSAITAPSGESTSAVRDPFGRVTSTTSADGVTTTITYSADTSVTVNGITSVYRIESDSSISPKKRTYHDKLGRVIRTDTESFDGSKYSKVETWYDSQGRVQRISLPYFSGTPQYSIHTYDLRGRSVAVGRPDGSSSTSTVYSAGSHQIIATITDNTNPGGVTKKRNTYDLLGWLVNTTDAYDSTDAVTTAYTFDAMGNMLSSAVNGGGAGTVTVTMEYDAAGNRTKIIDPNSGTTTTAYTALGQVKSVTDAKGQVTSFTYDALGRKTQRTQTYGRVDTWVWDSASYGVGKLASRSTANFSETYTYNSNHKLTGIATEITPLYPLNPEIFYAAFAYDGSGRLQNATDHMSHTVTYVYNSQGYLSQLKSGSTVLQAFNDMDAFGKVTQETYANGVVTTRGTDPQSGALTSINTTLGSTVLQDLDYTWRSNGILATRTSTVGSTQRKEIFGYDAHKRLTAAQTQINGITTRDLSYEYDLLGNILDNTSTVTSDTQATDYAYGAGSAGPNAVSSVKINGSTYTLTYDSNGAVTQYDAPGSLPDTQISYNVDNQPTSITVGTGPSVQESFFYGPDGERVYRRSTWTDGGGTHQEDTFYVGNFEYTAFTNDPTLLFRARTRISENVIRVMIFDVNYITDEDFEFAHRDHLGSIETVTDMAGAILQTMAFEPFGSRKSYNWQQNITGSELTHVLTNYYDNFNRIITAREARGFTNHEHLDRAGFIHMNGRLYDPRIGRFLTPDPIVQAPARSQSWNRYSYALNNPVSLVDPTGLASGPPPSGPVSSEELQRLQGIAEAIEAELLADQVHITFHSANVPGNGEKFADLADSLHKIYQQHGDTAMPQIGWIFGVEYDGAPKDCSTCDKPTQEGDSSKLHELLDNPLLKSLAVDALLNVFQPPGMISSRDLIKMAGVVSSSMHNGVSGSISMNVKTSGITGFSASYSLSDSGSSLYLGWGLVSRSSSSLSPRLVGSISQSEGSPYGFGGRVSFNAPVVQSSVFFNSSGISGNMTPNLNFGGATATATFGYRFKLSGPD